MPDRSCSVSDIGRYDLPVTSNATEAINRKFAAVSEATDRLLGTVDTLDDEALGGPSLLPDWTRGHVLAHLARNADGLVNLLLWAHTGVETPQYASDFLRDSDIADGATRTVSEQRTDIVESAQRLIGLATKLSDQQWNTEVRTRQGTPILTSKVPWMRLQELEIHHADLATGYEPSRWPTDFVAELLPEVAADLGRSAPEAFEIRATDTGFTATLGAETAQRTLAAPAPTLLAWLIGRDDGTDLPGPLPELLPWR